MVRKERSDKGEKRRPYKEAWIEEGERRGRRSALRSAIGWTVGFASGAFLLGFAASRTAMGQHDLTVNVLSGLITMGIGQAAFMARTLLKRNRTDGS